MNIAILLTCFNRKEKTLKCLSSLFDILPESEVYLVDDASSDGTSEEVQKIFPTVNILQGNGNLFWSRGMHMAWSIALKKKYDYYLWLNDDVELYPFFFQELIDCNNLGGGNCIISGLVEDFEKTRIIYGGSDQQKSLIQLTGNIERITYMNGNVVLVPKRVVEIIGIIDSKFHHDLGDIDYGLRAQKEGIQVYSTRKAVAIGHSNSFCRVRKWGAKISERFKILYSPSGANPNMNFYFRKKHSGVGNACAYWIFLHIINVLPDNMITLLLGNRYHDK